MKSWLMKLACNYVLKHQGGVMLRIDDSKRDYSRLCVDIDGHNVISTCFFPEDLRYLAEYMELQERGELDNVVSFTPLTKYMTVET